MTDDKIAPSSDHRHTLSDDMVADGASWLTLLPATERRILCDDLREATLDGPEAVEHVMLDWEATARIWADPDLLAALTGPIPEPLNVEVT